MNRNSLIEWITYERTLLSLYYKRNIKTIRSYISIFVVFIPNFFLFFAMISQAQYMTQKVFESETFWRLFIAYNLSFAPIASILLGGFIISHDFSRGTAQLIYTTISRKKYLISNLRFLSVHMLLLQGLSFLGFILQGIIILNMLLPIELLFVGFIFTYLYSLFYLSFSFILTSLTRSTIIALLVPFAYHNLSPMLISMDMKLLSINYYSDTISDRVLIYIWNGIISMNFEGALSIIVLIAIPCVLFIIAIFGFEVIEIRQE